MPSTFTNNGGIELPADGEKDGTWGDVVNLNMQIVDRLTNGVGAISLTGTTHTLTTPNGVVADGQYGLLVFGGSPTGTNTVTIEPNDAEKIYFVRNTTAQSVVVTQGSGGDVTVPTGTGAIIYADGAGTGAAVADLTAVFVPDLSNAGVTASTAELNILDGVTASTAELNYVDGVTSAIQTQLDAAQTAIGTKQATITGAATTIAADDLTVSRALVSNGSGKVAVSGVTSAELDVLDGLTASTAELNLLDGVTATTAEINYVDGVTSAIQTQIDNIPQPPELTQVQVEDDTSTVFGQVSGERLAQVSTKYIDAAEVTRNTAVSTVNPSGLSEVVFSSLSEPFYQFYFDGIYPASSDANVELYAYMSGDNGSTWAFVGDTSAANWRLNGGGSGMFLLNTLVGVGHYALGYKNANSSKVGRFISPTGATLPINAVRFRWWDTDPGSLVNFGTDLGQSITQYAR